MFVGIYTSIIFNTHIRAYRVGLRLTPSELLVICRTE